MTELGARLRGPARLKADLLAEASDGLSDAAAAGRATGLDPAAAQRRAIEEFGPLALVGAAYQRELGLAQGRRTALWVLLVIAAQPFVWGTAHEAAVGRSARHDVLEMPVQVVGGLAGLTALLLVLASCIGLRYLPGERFLARVSGRFGLTVAVLLSAGGLLLTLRSPTETMLRPSGLPWTVAFLFLPLLGVALSARRSLRAAG